MSTFMRGRKVSKTLDALGSNLSTQYLAIKSSLWRSNYAPSEDQKALLNEYLLYLDKDLAALRRTIQRWAPLHIMGTVKKLEMQCQRRHECTSLLSPCRLLPIEILSKIVDFAVQSRETTPRTICNVCSAWRSAAMLQPSSWKNDFVQVSFTKENLLSCTVDYQHNDTQLPAARTALLDLAPIIPLMSSISLSHPLCTPFLLLPPGMIPHLYHFESRGCEGGVHIQDISVFTTAPNLKSVKLDDCNFAPILSKIPVRQLTHLDIQVSSYWNDVYTYIADCPNLVSLSLRVYTVGPTVVHPLPKQIILPKLLNLRLRDDTGMKFRAFTRLPFQQPLTSLELIFRHYNDFPVDFFQLLSHSLGHIQRLCISPSSVPADSLWRLIAACTSLQELAFVDDWSAEELRGVLVELKDNTPALPLLRKFTLVFRHSLEALHAAHDAIYSLISHWLQGESRRQRLDVLSLVLERPGVQTHDAFMSLLGGLKVALRKFMRGGENSHAVFEVTGEIVDFPAANARWYLPSATSD